MNPAPLKLAIVDDHRLIRKSLKLLIENTFGDIRVLIEAENGQALLDQLKFTAVDVILLDIEMPVMNGYETCRNLHRFYPETKILIISQFFTTDCVDKALECGAHGYVTKSSNPDLLEAAIRTVHGKGFYFDPELGSALHELIKGNRRPAPENPLSVLSGREMEIVRISAKGFNTPEIADKLCITVRTLETHRKRIIEKTEANNFTGVILLALKHGCVTVSEL